MSSKRKTRSSSKQKMVEENAAKKPREYHSNVQITSLNDDCLLEIFSHLSDMDLCAVKEAHDRFHQAADDAFKRKFLPSLRWYEVNGKRDFDEIAKIVTNFGHKILHLSLEFEKKNYKCKCRYIVLLKKCTALLNIRFQHVEFKNLSISPKEIGVFRNLIQVDFGCGRGTEEYYKLFLTHACDIMKLRNFRLEYPISDELLAFLLDRSVNICSLSLILNKATPLFAENVMKMKNLRLLTSLTITCANVPKLPAINALAECKSLEKLVLRMDSVSSKVVAKAINSIPNMKSFILLTKRKISYKFTDLMTKKMKYQFGEHWTEPHKHRYQFDQCESGQNIPKV